MLICHVLEGILTKSSSLFSCVIFIEFHYSAFERMRYLVFTAHAKVFVTFQAHMCFSVHFGFVRFLLVCDCELIHISSLLDSFAGTRQPLSKQGLFIRC